MPYRKRRDSLTPPSGYYVYTLAWPNGEVFYVGKGKGSRAEEHLKEAERWECFCKKCRTIHRIWAKRQQVQVTFVFETNNSKAALAKEAELIRALAPRGALTNKDGVCYIAPERSVRERIKGQIEALQDEIARRGLPKARRAEARQELADLKQSIGDGWQRSFDLLEDGPDFDWTNWRK